jgi:hypothetical protein
VTTKIKRTHTWDATREICTACGRTAQEIVDRKLGCDPKRSPHRPITLPRVRFLEKKLDPEEDDHV